MTDRYLKKNKDNPLEKAEDILRKMENLKKNEINRIIKNFIGKDLDDEMRIHLAKLFKFLFGKKESEEVLSRFLREKRVK